MSKKREVGCQGCVNNDTSIKCYIDDCPGFKAIDHVMTKQEIEARNKCDRFMCRGAKLGNNNSIYGYYSSVGSEYYIEDKSRKKQYVHKNTLSQCTGVKDKNGVMIFENDIAIINNIVMTLDYIAEEKTFIFYRLDKGLLIPYARVIDCHNFEIIGDKFANPELLESSHD